MTSPIVDGELDTTTKGVVALAYKFQNHQVSVFCSGSLLAPNLVLTARHCIAQIGDGTSETVNCGVTKFTAKISPRAMVVSTDAQPQSDVGAYSVKQIIEAPGGDDVCGFDVALLILGSNVPASEALPIEPVLDDPTLAKVAFSAVGYGVQDPKDTQGMTAGTRMRSDASSVYCVGAACPIAAGAEADEFVGNSRVCPGDSGGPALDAKGRVFGVTSRGDAGCTYALYSNVASWSDFVRSTATDAANQGGYAPHAWITPGPTTFPGFGGASSVGTGGASAGGSVASGGGGASSAGQAAGGDDTAAGGAGTPPPITSGPTVDPLNVTCNTSADCPGNYQCYSSTSMPPGKCVPACSSDNTTCPTNYSCSLQYGVCTPNTVHKVSSSCSVSDRPHTGSNTAFATLLGLGLVWFGRRRRALG